MSSFKINCTDIANSIASGLSGLPHAISHYTAETKTCLVTWAHRLIGCIEAISVLGFLVVIIEAIRASSFTQNSSKQEPVQTLIDTGEIENYLRNDTVSVRRDDKISSISSEVIFDNPPKKNKIKELLCQIQ